VSWDGKLQLELRVESRSLIAREDTFVANSPHRQLDANIYNVDNISVYLELNKVVSK
jgi:hypothetical protein